MADHFWRKYCFTVGHSLNGILNLLVFGNMIFKHA